MRASGLIQSGGGDLLPHPNKLLLVEPGIDGRVADRDVAQVDLNGADVIAVVDHIEAAPVPEHMGIHAGQGGRLAALLQELVHGAAGEGASALGYK